ncbi:galactose mutarotase-like domain-containing protein [Tirmania nivea]|nr:galactose mutarotase-like domain-containing protein [Tirmania nivea]
MKFRDRMWLVRDSVRLEYAEEVRKLSWHADGIAMNLLCPAKKIHSRGDTLNLPVFSIDLEYVFDDVIPVTRTHWKAGALSATVTSKEHIFDIRFHSTDGDETITSLQDSSMGIAYNPLPISAMQLADMRGFKHYIFTQHNLGVGEQIFGLGERFTAFNKVGQSVTLTSEDGERHRRRYIRISPSTYHHASTRFSLIMLRA